jgi:PLP dependent protein
MHILQKILKETADKQATLVVVSKTQSFEKIISVYDQGQRDFGENRVQELLDKVQNLPTDIRWHLIGHLQTNKVKYIVPFVYLIHSVDSIKVWEEINKEAQKINRVIPILLQVKIAKEKSKYGFDKEELRQAFEDGLKASLIYTEVRGLMGMGTFTDDMSQVKNEFLHLRNIFVETKGKFFTDTDNFNVLSMGMSGDYKIALECGSTMVRIGSAIFS